MAEGLRKLSYKATHAALFINLYRFEPILHMPFRFLTLLVDIDEMFTTWRYKHALMVHRMIGAKVGTGGSSGHHYLLQTAEKHKIFTDLFDLSTYLIPKSMLPKLPPDIERELGFYYTYNKGKEENK
jgi:tryptophan 2,3-dioxygenase